MNSCPSVAKRHTYQRDLLVANNSTTRCTLGSFARFFTQLLPAACNERSDRFFLYPQTGRDVYARPAHTRLPCIPLEDHTITPNTRNGRAARFLAGKKSSAALSSTLASRAMASSCGCGCSRPRVASLSRSSPPSRTHVSETGSLARP